MLKPPGRFSVLLFALCVSLGTTLDKTSAAPLTKIRVGYPSPSASMYPLFVTKEAGLFEKHGLDADLVYVQEIGRAHV